jgi:hypothetical protein
MSENPIFKLPSTLCCNDNRQRCCELTDLSARIGDCLCAFLHEAQDVSIIRCEEQAEHTVKLPCCVDVGDDGGFLMRPRGKHCRELPEQIGD